MAEAIAFDTHRFVKRLTESGFTEKQAETLAEEHVALLNANLATKADIASIKADIDALRQQTTISIEALRQQTRASIEAGEGGSSEMAVRRADRPGRSDRGPRQTSLGACPRIRMGFFDFAALTLRYASN